MNRSTHKLLLLATVVLFAGVALAGCATNDGNGDGTGAPGVMTACAGGASTAEFAPGPTPDAPVMTPATLPLPNLADQAGEPLKIGTLLPLTGALAAYGPDMQKGTELAVMQINAAGGINGQQVQLVHEDGKSDPTQAPIAFNSLVNQEVAAVVGAASSGVTGSILDAAIQANIPVLTPASTSPDLTLGRDNEGWFFRVPPSDALQGRVLADLVYDSGCRSASILALNNAYGSGLGSVFTEAFESKGGSVTRTVEFESTGTTFTSQVQQAGQGNPDAIVLIGYPEQGNQIMKEAYQTGVTGRSVFFFSEGLYTPAFVTGVGNTTEGTPILAGLGGTTPRSAQTNATQDFLDAFEAEYGHEPGLFAAESYDATWAIALAAAKAGENTGEAIKGALREVYNKPGTDVTGGGLTGTIAALFAAGGDINYVGATGDFDWDENGDPASGIYAYWKVGQDGALSLTQENIQPEA